MNIFGDLFNFFIHAPLVNLLQLLYNLTGDIGISIILLTILVNTALLPLFAKSYITGQKRRILQPQTQAIMQNYKDDPLKARSALAEFNKKHGIGMGGDFLRLFIQIFVFTGIYLLARDVAENKTINGLYSGIFGDTKATFSTEAFGFINIGAKSIDYPIILFMSFVFSYLYGMYVFRWSPKIDLPKAINPVKPENPALDPEVMQKQQEFMGIYFAPIMNLVINYNIPTGANLYIATTTIYALVRQIFLTNFYAKHTDQLLKDIAESDPTMEVIAKAENKDEDSVNPELLADQSSPTAIVPAKIDSLKNKKTKKKKK